MLAVIDNYDSFTYNLVQYLGELGAEMTVYRNDALTVDELEGLNPSGIIISPGPGTPDDGGISVDTIKRFHGKLPLLGVCLGHQCIGQAFGGVIHRNARIMHGKTSMIRHDGKGVFRGLDNPFEATRYHSLAIDPDSVPEILDVTAETDQGEIMGVRHKAGPTFGVQFHPESILTVEGKALLANFLRIMRG